MIRWGLTRTGKASGRGVVAHAGAWLKAAGVRLVAAGQAITINTGPGNALSAPVITRTSGVTTYPVTFDINRPVDWQDGDKLITRWSTDGTFAGGVNEGTPVVLAGGTTTLSTGVSAIVSGNYLIESAGYHGSRPANLNWSNIIGVGDAVGPVVTGDTQTVANLAPFTITVTADKLSTFVLGGADAAAFEKVGSEPATSITLRLVGNASTNWSTQSSYTITVTPTSLFGVAGSAATFVRNVAAPMVLDPANKHTSIVLSNGNLTMTGNAGVGAPQKIRSTNTVPTGKGYFEVHYDTHAHDLFVGLVDTVYSAYTSDTTDPYTTTHSIALVGEPGYNDIRGPSSALTDLTATLGGATTGSVFQVAYDTVAGKMWPGINNTYSGNPAAGTGGFTIPTGALYALLYVNSSDVATFRPTAASQTYAAPSGFTSIA